MCLTYRPVLQPLLWFGVRDFQFDEFPGLGLVRQNNQKRCRPPPRGRNSTLFLDLSTAHARCCWSRTRENRPIGDRNFPESSPVSREAQRRILPALRPPYTPRKTFDNYRTSLPMLGSTPTQSLLGLKWGSEPKLVPRSGSPSEFPSARRWEEGARSVQAGHWSRSQERCPCIQPTQPQRAKPVRLQTCGSSLFLLAASGGL